MNLKGKGNKDNLYLPGKRRNKNWLNEPEEGERDTGSKFSRNSGRGNIKKNRLANSIKDCREGNPVISGKAGEMHPG